MAVALVAMAGCSAGGKSSSAPTTTSSTTSPAPGSGGAGVSTSVPIQTTGVRTVLSPVGLNVRSMPSTSAPAVGSAAEGATLNVLGHTDQGGGWYQVMGATVSSGYITDNPMDSAAGSFLPYSDNAGAFSALYPSKWTATATQPDGVVFRPPTGSDSIVVSVAPTLGQLAPYQLGYHQDTATTLVACGVTGELVTSTQSTSTAATVPPLPGGAVAQRYLIQIDLKLDATHVLGVAGFVSDLSQAAPVDEVIDSLSFPVPQCQGGTDALPGATTSTMPTTTVF